MERQIEKLFDFASSSPDYAVILFPLAIWNEPVFRHYLVRLDNMYDALGKKLIRIGIDMDDENAKERIAAAVKDVFGYEIVRLPLLIYASRTGERTFVEGVKF